MYLIVDVFQPQSVGLVRALGGSQTGFQHIADANGAGRLVVLDINRHDLRFQAPGDQRAQHAPTRARLPGQDAFHRLALGRICALVDADAQRPVRLGHDPRGVHQHHGLQPTERQVAVSAVVDARGQQAQAALVVRRLAVGNVAAAQ